MLLPAAAAGEIYIYIRFGYDASFRGSNDAVILTLSLSLSLIIIFCNHHRYTLVCVQREKNTKNKNVVSGVVTPNYDPCKIRLVM